MAKSKRGPASAPVLYPPFAGDHPTTRTEVIHIRDMNPGDVYIGRANRRFGLAGSKWANPFRIERGVRTRQQAIDEYRSYVQGRPELMAALPELRGRRLACWCTPAPCHGDVLAELAEAAPC